MSSGIDTTSENKRIVFEQYRDVNNTYGVFGYVLRWTFSNCVEVDVFEIITGRRTEDGWWTGLDFESGDEEMLDPWPQPGEPKNTLDLINPSYHLYMKYDGTAHLWQSNYSGSGDADSILYTTEMLRYIATRAAQYIQERLNAKEENSLDEHTKVYPLKYRVPEIQVRPYTPDPV
jgi:hypothetical protein